MHYNKLKIVEKSDKIFDCVNFILMFIALLIVLYPLYFVIIASFSEPVMVASGKVWFFPKGVTLDGYKLLLQQSEVWLGYRNSILYATVGTFINLAVTLPAAYALSRKDFKARKICMMLFTFTMLFNGGLVPTYLVVRQLGLLNKMAVMVVIDAMTVWNLIIARSFFDNLPGELRDAAVIDGCDNVRLFFQIVLPLSKAMIAVIALYYAVMHWNTFFSALIYLSDMKKYPLQMFLRDILIQNEQQSTLFDGDPELANVKLRLAELVKYCIIIVGSIPVIIAYPFVQKYFVKGVMIGAVKG